MAKKLGIARLLGMTFGAALAASLAYADDAPVSMVLMTTPKNDDEIRMIDNRLMSPHPGYHAELLQDAGKRCHLNVQLRFAPWQRALLEVKNGNTDGAFSASYDTERAAYGAYPLTAKGQPDRNRALKDYSYSLYAPISSLTQWDGLAFRSTNAQKVAVERGASIIPKLNELGIDHVEIADNTTMLRMLANNRVAAAVLMTSAADAILAESPELASMVQKHQPPIEEKVGYVILSRHFQARYPQHAECFWNTIAAIRGSAAYAARIEFYRDNK
ncbi:MAG: transporter substrate-binding domain-containing protein [Magnetospirillum gryphiswaldense]|nr:transporter substrate-binding domain-containing protein [Magnetospirillum gryphiswaldense]